MKFSKLKTSILSAFFVFSLFYSGHSNAQTILKLEDCIQMAIHNSYQLQSDSLLSQSLQMLVKQEQSAYNPQISGSAGISGLFLSPYTFGQHYLQALADWDLGRFWHKTADIQQKQSEQQEAVIQQNKLEITGVITGLYLDVLQSQLEREILQSKIDYLSGHIEILTVLWKAGTIRQLDILQTQSSLNTVKEELMQKELVAEQAKYAIARLTGLNASEQFSLALITNELPLPAEVSQVPETWLENHPKAQILQKEYEKELLMKKDVQAGFMPHIQAFSGYTFDGDPTGDGNYFLLGLGATIPVFSWKKKDYKMREIDFTAEAIQTQKKNAERDLSIQFGQLLQQISRYRKIIDFQQEKIAAEREVAKVVELNYKAGLATNLDFLMAQQTLTETELNVNNVRNQYLKSVVAFWLLSGQTEEIKNIQP
ncbi:TolC family protein [uncultured Draconibacterium sp.]|uniref:TolC family protein n=1 Tax=uncultured Draconibacterium sp. TaxID=1573823 RepID=UPI0029C89B65|nr:TolC family protein [uncultured Draconibacterium sp.]